MWKRAGASVLSRALLLIGACALTGCDIGPTYDPPVRIVIAPWIGYTPLYIARDRGLYGGLDVRIAEFSTDFDASRAMADGRAELACGTVADLLRQRDQGVDLEFIAALDFSNGADGIVARPPIEDVAGLRGKRVAAEVGTLTHFMLLRALERAKVAEAEVTIVNVATEAALEALEKGEVDAASLWEPFLSKAEKAGSKRVFSSAEIPGEILDVIAAPSGVLASRPRDIERVLRAWDGALGVIKREPGYALPLMAERVGMTVPELEESLKAIELIDIEQNIRLFSREGGAASATYLKVAGFMAQTKLFKDSPAPPGDVLNPLFLERAAAR